MRTNMMIVALIACCIGYLTVADVSHAQTSNAQNIHQVGARTWIKEGKNVYANLNPAAAKNAAVVQGARATVALSVSFDPPQIETNGEYSRVRMTDLDVWNGDAGSPMLPFMPMRILAPYGEQVVGVRIIPGASQSLEGEYLLEPAQMSVPLSRPELAGYTPPDPAIYNAAGPYPYVPCGDAFLQKKYGYDILIVNLFPVEYQPANKKISYYPEMIIEVETVPAKNAAVRAAGSEFSPKPEKRNEIAAMVDNPEDLETYLTTETSSRSGTEYKYVIITTNALRYAGTSPYTLDDLAADKEARGISTLIVTEDVYNTYPGNRPDGGVDTQTRIRNFIVDYYQNYGTEYVLLAGDKSNIPIRAFYVNSGVRDDYGTQIISTNMPVDMYFSCLDGTFDYDGDGIYGEPGDGVGGGEVDLYAEVFIGRAPVANGTEITNFVKKTLEYEYAADDYLRTPYMAGEKLAEDGPSEYATGMMEEIRLGSDAHGYSTAGFEDLSYTYYFDTQTLYDSPDYLWTKSDIISIMNSGVHIINHLGHSSTSTNMKLHWTDLTSLTNDNYFFVYSQGCYPGAFDNSFNFAEAITTKEKGAFAVIMNTRYGWYNYFTTDGASQRFNREFWDALFSEGIVNLGKMNQDSKEDNISGIGSGTMRWCYYELTLFGDPETILKTPVTWYVDDDAPSGGDGTSWGNAFTTIQQAINAADYGDLVIVAEGEYVESINFNGKEVYLKSVDPDDPAVVAATVINTHSSQPCFEFNNGEDEGSIVEGFTLTASSSSPLIRCYNDSHPTLNRCVLEDCYFGIYFTGGSATLTHCIIRNITGYCFSSAYENSDLLFENCLFYNNGNAITHGSGGSLTVTNCTFANNATRAIYKSGTPGIVTNCILWDNGDDLNNCNVTYSCVEEGATGVGNISSNPCFADAANDNYHLAGYSPCIDAGNTSVVDWDDDIDNGQRIIGYIVDMGADESIDRMHNLTRDTWHSSLQAANDNAYNGDVIVVLMGDYVENPVITKDITLESIDPSNPDVIAGTIFRGGDIVEPVITFDGANCEMSGFTIADGLGGGVLCDNSNLTMTHCIIENNEAQNGGGAYITASSNGVLKNCVIRNNEAELEGGGVYADGYSSVDLINCTIQANETAPGNGGVSGGVYAASAYVTIVNSIVWGNIDSNDQIDGAQVNPSNVDVSYSCIQDEFSNDVIPFGGTANHNIDDDPLFIEDSYHISSLSGCANSGNNSVVDWSDDIDGENRIICSAVDMGADETYPVKNITQGAEYTTIQAAINGAVNGDVIVVGPGVYNETFKYYGKAITVRSYDPDDPDIVAATIIDLTGTIYLYYGEGPDSILEGLTIKGPSSSAAIYSSTSSYPTIRKCIIEEGGYGIACAGGSVLVTHCIIRNNTYSAIYSYYYDSCLQIENCLIYNNGYGIQNGATNSQLTVINCTVVSNGSKGIASTSVTGQVANCIVWDNGDDLVNCCAIYSCIQDGDSGTGNFSSNPRFMNAANGDYHLTPDVSPCIDSGYNYAVDWDEDIDGNDRIIGGSVDMGFDESTRVQNVTRGIWYETIQEAIDESRYGNDIVAWPGVYDESINFNGRVATIRSLDPDDPEVVAATIIAPASGVCFEINHGENEDTRIEGLTISGISSGIMRCSYGVHFNKCIIDGGSFGLYFTGGSGIFTHCVIRNITGSAISSAYLDFDLLMENCLIYNNGSGVSHCGGALTVTNCTFVSNGTKGIYKSGTPGIVTNCIFWDNGDELYNCTASYSCIEGGYSGYTNISSNPIFVNPYYGDYHLMANASPCIDMGNSSAVDWDEDIDGNDRIISDAVDMGAYETYRVNNITQGTKYMAIQDAIDGAVDDDVIVVEPGVYNETIKYYGKAITVRSSDPDDPDIVAATIIDLTGTIYLYYGESPDSILEGLTIKGPSSSAAIYSSTSSYPTIRKCIIEDGGYGIACAGGSVLVTHCIIRNNTYSAIYSYYYNSCLQIKNCLIYNNGKGIQNGATNSQLTVVNCTVVSNGGQGIASTSVTGQVANCIVWDNGDDLYNCCAIYSCIQDGDSNTGNISSNPCFMNPSTGDYHLHGSSPCINSGFNYAVDWDEDIDGDDRIIYSVVDMGADEYNPY